MSFIWLGMSPAEVVDFGINWCRAPNRLAPIGVVVVEVEWDE